MAQYIFDTTEEEDAATALAVERYNAQQLTEDAKESPRQFLMRQWQHRMAFFVREYRAHLRKQHVTTAELLARVSPDDHATITAVLDKYRGKER